MEFTGERVVPGKVPLDLYNEHLVRYLFARQYARQGMRILDAGCGTGYGTFLLAGVPGVSVVGVDASNEALEFARGNYSRPNCLYEQDDLLDPRTVGPFDLIVSFEVIEHLSRPIDFLNAMKSLLAPTGVLVVSTPNRKMYSDAIPNYSNPFHVKEYYYDEFNTLVGSVFPSCRMFRQDFLEGMIVAPLNVDPATDIATVKSIEEGVVEPQDSSFFLAVCGNADSDANAHIFPFAASNILAEKDRYIQALKTEVLLRDEATRALQQELTVKTDWIESLKREVKIRDEAVQYLNESVDSASQHIEALYEAATGRDQKIFNLQGQIDSMNTSISAMAMEISKRDVATQAVLDELRTKTDWIEIMKEEVAKRDIATETLQHELSEKSRWIEQLQEEVRKRDEVAIQLNELLNRNTH